MPKGKNIFKHSWLQTYWRPLMALTYTFICIWDFFAAPIFFQIVSGNGLQWKPLTLEGSGIFHASMGAIVGVAAWTRGIEKQKIIENFDKISDTKIDFNNSTPEEKKEEPKKEEPKKQRRSYKDVVNGN